MNGSPSTRVTGLLKNHFNQLLSMLRLFLILLVSISIGPKFCFAGNPCQLVSLKLDLKLAVKPSEFRECLRGFPWKKKQANAILDTMWKTLVNVYPYTNLVKKSPSVDLPLTVRFRKRLIDLKAKNFTSDFDFHKELYEIVKSLEDGHTSWEPECYTRGVVLTAFPLVKTFDPQMNASRVKISPAIALEALEDSHSLGLVFKHTEEALNVSIEGFSGAEVTEINGVNVLEYVEEFAKSVGDYRDQQARTNLLFFRPSFTPGQFYPGSLMKLPLFFLDKDHINYTIRRVNQTSPETLQVPFFVYYKGPKFNGSDSFYALNCKADPASNPMAPKDKALEGRIRHHEPNELPSLRHRELERAQFEPTGLIPLSNETEDVQVYLLSDNITAVMTIPDFLGRATKNASLSSTEAAIAFLEELLLAYNRVRVSGAKRLIIDVSNNGGGFVVTGTFLTQLLFPEGGDPQFNLQLRAEPFALAAYQRASYNLSGNSSSDYDYAAWRNAHTRLPFPQASDFFLPLLTVRQFDRNTQFSSYFVDKSYYEIIQKYDPAILPTSNLFKAEDIIVLSNGLCFSTCGVFTYQLRQRYNVKFVTVGGNDEPNPFAFAAGTVGFVTPDFKFFYETEVVNLGLENETFSPKPLPIKGRLRWTMAQAIGPRSSTIPQEFIYEPGQFKLPYTEVTSLSLPQLWNRVKDYF